MGRGLAEAGLMRQVERFSREVPTYILPSNQSAPPIAEQPRLYLSAPAPHVPERSAEILLAQGDKGPTQTTGSAAVYGETAQKNDPYSFIHVTIEGAPIENFREKLSDDLISYVREMIYSRMVMQFPELQNIDPAKFKDMLHFNFYLGWRNDGEVNGGSLDLFILAGHGICYSSKNVLMFDENDVLNTKDILKSHYRTGGQRTSGQCEGTRGRHEGGDD